VLKVVMYTENSESMAKYVRWVGNVEHISD